MATGNSKNKTTAASGRKTSAQGSSKQSASKGGRKAPAAQGRRDGIAREAAVLITLALSVIFFIANFGIGGVVGAGISSFFFGLFGLVAYIFPLILFGGTIFAISNKNNSVARIKIIAGVFVMLLLCTLIQLISGAHASEWKFTQYYTECSAHKNGGGFFGGSVCKLFVTWFGTIGAYIIDIVLIIIGIVVISERSFIAGLKRGGKKVYDTTVKDVEQYRENAEEKRKIREENRLKRAADKVRGVTFDTEIPKEDEDSEDNIEDIREIKAGAPDSTDKPGRADSSYENDKSAKLDRLDKLIKPDRTVKEEPKPEPVFNFEKAQSNAEILPFDEDDRYINAQDISEYAIKHYEDEQSSPFENYGNFAEEEILPEISYDAEQDTDTDTDTGYIDMSLVREEFERELEDRRKTATEAQPEPEQNEAAGYAENADTDIVRPESEQPVTPEAEPEKTPEQAQQQMPLPPRKKPRKYVFPPLNLLKRGNGKNGGADKEELKSTAMKLQQTLANFGVKVTVTDVSCGPAVTRYEIQPEQGVKVSKIVSLADDIKLNLAAADIRIEAPIPGKAAVGIEVPNKENSGVMLGDLICSSEFKNHPSPIAFAAGKDIAGQTVMTDIAKMPHLLIAGATGSGKSVCINTIIMSILYRAKPDDVKLIMVDPKVVELSVYNGIPHLMIPVVTDPKKAAGALNWAVAEMTDRYQKFAAYGVRDLKGYNEKVEALPDTDDANKPVKLPQIVIIVDELADLMMVALNEVEDAIVRLAQLARAAGIHLIIATQRPSVNVITGLIKANVPSRIAFSVSSGVDSRTIIDMVGAEKLLGKGDMLFYPQGYQKPARVQGAFVSDEEVSAVVEFLKEHCDSVEYSEEVSGKLSNPAFEESQSFGGDRDQYFGEAGRFIIEKERASIGMLQRVYKIGFNRAARIMDQLCDAGVVGPEEGTKPRKVLMTLDEFEAYLRSN